MSLVWVLAVAQAVALLCQLILIYTNTQAVRQSRKAIDASRELMMATEAVRQIYVARLAELNRVPPGEKGVSDA